MKKHGHQGKSVTISVASKTTNFKGTGAGGGKGRDGEKKVHMLRNAKHSRGATRSAKKKKGGGKKPGGPGARGARSAPRNAHPRGSVTRGKGENTWVQRETKRGESAKERHNGYNKSKKWEKKRFKISKKKGKVLGQSFGNYRLASQRNVKEERKNR